MNSLTYNALGIIRQAVHGASTPSGICTDPSNEMVTVQQKAQYVLWFAEFKSIVTVHHNFIPGQHVPQRRAICRWVKSFCETDTIQKKQSSGWPRTTNEKTMEKQRKGYDFKTRQRRATPAADTRKLSGTWEGGGPTSILPSSWNDALAAC
ncbi:hypothetical protein PR048_026455 [Dryococelus australis]|uniref:DUF4817 domain-containing protein n=1 Tax=Dryococelus australis TaxID=614101 RepID=A0ABQ9GLC7_9NEOP|nr:hypothetical protein PR048_026455 [Dryococelus australis]